jgi:hypothetical protein
MLEIYTYVYEIEIVYCDVIFVVGL